MVKCAPIALGRCGRFIISAPAASITKWFGAKLFDTENPLADTALQRCAAPTRSSG
jgi:hypothetical protein